MKILFLGNSATYVHEIPQWLQRAAGQAGYPVEVGQLTPGGYTLYQHADAESEHGQQVLTEIARGYDVVMLQDNGNCILSQENRARSRDAAARLCTAIRKSGAKPFFYVRPPYGYASGPYDPLAQCSEFDAHFGAIAAQEGMGCAYANRAFAEAIMHLPYELWGEDHAHTSLEGAYLILCTLSGALFGASSGCLDAAPLDPETARVLQQTADRVNGL